MTPSLRQALAALPARQLNLVAIGAVAIVAALMWTLAIRAPLAALRQQQVRLVALRAAQANAPAPLPAGSPAAGSAALPPLPAAPAPLALIAAAGASARAAGLTVGGAVPGAERSIAGLRQQTLDIEASGSYGAILDWLDGIEARQPAVGIVRLNLRAAPEEARRLVQLQLGAYGTEAKR
jgi:type II secretory pathway component PulM